MRLAATVTALALVVSCTAARAVEDVTMKTLAAGSYAAHSSGRKAVLAKNEDEYQRLFASLVADGQAPAVDFTHGVAVLLVAGQRSTGGYAIEPSGVTIEDHTAVIRAAVKAPPPGSMVTQVITSPWAVVFVNTTDITEVRWEP